MFSGNGTIDYSVEAHSLDAHKTSAARQGSTTRNLQIGIFVELIVPFKKSLHITLTFGGLICLQKNNLGGTLVKRLATGRAG